jgi:hypothetical protein
MTKNTILYLTQPIWSIATLELHGNFAAQQQQSFYSQASYCWNPQEPKHEDKKTKRKMKNKAKKPNRKGEMRGDFVVSHKIERSELLLYWWIYMKKLTKNLILALVQLICLRIKVHTCQLQHRNFMGILQDAIGSYKDLLHNCIKSKA